MSKGTRAMIVAALVIVIAAVLAYLLKDGSIFTTSGSAAVLGKFVADAARDFPTKPDDS